MINLGAEPVGSTPAGYGDFLKAEMVRWSKVVRSAGIKSE